MYSRPAVSHLIDSHSTSDPYKEVLPYELGNGAFPEAQGQRYPHRLPHPDIVLSTLIEELERTVASGSFRSLERKRGGILRGHMGG